MNVFFFDACRKEQGDSPLRSAPGFRRCDGRSRSAVDVLHNAITGGACRLFEGRRRCWRTNQDSDRSRESGLRQRPKVEAAVETKQPRDAEGRFIRSLK